MSGLTKSVVLHTAKLAKIPLTEKETEVFSGQLSEIVGHFKELNEVNTDSTEATSQTTGLTDVLRADNIKPKNIIPVSDALRESKSTHNNLFIVPYLLENK